MEVGTHVVSSFDLNSKPPFSFRDRSELRGSDFRSSDISTDSEKPPELEGFGSPVAGVVECNDDDGGVHAGMCTVPASSDVTRVENGRECVGFNSAGVEAPVGKTASCPSNAAMRVQKVYRSYRTRRMLADSAVVAEELWWQAIDYARLNHSTISFFNFLKPETAASRWNRITLNASKVGKGLSKDAKAQKLAFQHWIEAIDPRHRYGHNLHIYYDEWCKTDAGQPFFFWLDLGDGRKVDLEECSRAKLQKQCIKYLGPQEREHYEYIIVGGQILHKQTGCLLDTIKGSPGAKWIFVMSTSKRLYAGEKKKGMFHHSSFLAGGATLAAGRLVVEDGTLKSISAYSGHYRPKDESLDSFLSFLKENGVNLDQVVIKRANEDYESYDDGKSIESHSTSELSTLSDGHPQADLVKEEENGHPSESTGAPQGQPTNSYKRTLSGGLQSPRAEVPKTAILQRINSKKSAKSYQLGHQLSLAWSTGAGPRIGCVADYPAELRWHALEMTNLSPRPPCTPSTLRPLGALVSPTWSSPVICNGGVEISLNQRFPSEP